MASSTGRPTQRGADHRARGPTRRSVKRGAVPSSRCTNTSLVTSEKEQFYELVTPGRFESFQIELSDSAPSATPPPRSPHVPPLVAAIQPCDVEIIGDGPTRGCGGWWFGRAAQ